jgi:hypothetical protein
LTKNVVLSHRLKQIKLLSGKKYREKTEERQIEKMGEKEESRL